MAALKEQVEKVRADYIRAEKEAKTAEITLSLQAVQHEKTVSNLHKELEALQEAAKLHETVEELRVQNQEMEELLKAKCLEIEENDDRFIEYVLYSVTWGIYADKSAQADQGKEEAHLKS